ARRDVLDGADGDGALALIDVGFRVRPAGVIDVAGGVAAVRTVDGPAAVDLEQILVLDRVVLFLPAIEHPAKILDDLGALGDGRGGEQAEPGAGAADAIRLAGRTGGHELRFD